MLSTVEVKQSAAPVNTQPQGYEAQTTEGSQMTQEESADWEAFARLPLRDKALAIEGAKSLADLVP